METHVKNFLEKLLTILRQTSPMPSTSEVYSNNVARMYVKNTFFEIAMDPSLAFEIATDKWDQTLHRASDGSGSEIKFRCGTEALAAIKKEIYSEEICEVGIPKIARTSHSYMRAEEEQAIRFWEHVSDVIKLRAEVLE